MKAEKNGKMRENTLMCLEEQHEPLAVTKSTDAIWQRVAT